MFKSASRIASYGLASAVFAAAMAASGVASAATVVCPNPLTGNQDNTYQTTSATDCVWGDVNIGQGNPANDGFLTGTGTNDIAYGDSGPTFGLTGWTLIESSQDAAGMSTMTSLTLTNITTTSFDWVLNNAAYGDYALGLVNGEDPKWGVFLLEGSSGTASMTGGSWSHIVLYGTGDPEAPPPLPEPAMLGLLGLGLVGIVAARRRRAA